MNTKHTPGPWRVHPYEVRCGEYNSGRDVGTAGRAVCTAIGEFEAGEMGAEAMANAALIAAAPELLAALHFIADEAHDPEMSVERIVAVARAAIAKAG